MTLVNVLGRDFGLTLGNVLATNSGTSSCMLEVDSTEKQLVGLLYPPAVRRWSVEKEDGRSAGPSAASSLRGTLFPVDASWPSR